MTPSRFALLDPAAGISGDMLLGALIDVGAPEAWLRELPSRLGLPEVRVAIQRVRRCGVAATRVHVMLADGRAEQPAPLFPHPEGDQGEHDHMVPPGAPGTGHGHRRLADILRILAQARISPPVRRRAAAAFELLCEAEGRVHGVGPEAVVLHEVGAADAIVDIVGGIEGFEQLGIERVHVAPVALGRGWVRAAHGVMAVPAPATLRLLEGLAIGPNGPVTGEATTPTGAVLLRVLNSGPVPDAWRPVANGWGAGGRDPGEYPNALRLVLGESAAEAARVVTLSSDLDDLSPEYVEPLREALMAAGALDVVLWGTQMKKGRPGYRVEVTCDTPSTEAVIEAFFLHSTTSGLRRTVGERVTLARRQLAVRTADGLSGVVKVVDTPAGPRVKAEFDTVREAARRSGRPALDVAREMERQAYELMAHMPPAGTPLPKEKG